MFSHVDLYPGDPILGLLEAFQADNRPSKVNLGVGLYYDEHGAVPVMHCVAAARGRLAGQSAPCTYLPMEGMAQLRHSAQLLLFGDEIVPERERIASVQTLGGSGGLKLGADFLKRYFPDSTVWISDPSWDNHVALFEGAGLKVKRYPYYDKATKDLRFSEMLESLGKLSPRDIVLLHPCCHNPTGVDLDQSQWDLLLQVVETADLIPFFDIAYQGFGQGLDTDAYAVRSYLRRGRRFLACQSFSKNFSLYGERVGCLHVICGNANEAERVFGQLKLGVRRLYSSPPEHGAQLISHVLSDPTLRSQWAAELDAMRQRLHSMRVRLFDALSARIPDQDFSYLQRQQGMFSYTGLLPQQITWLKEERGVYLVQSGRICVTGLNPANIDYVADVLADALQIAPA